MSNLKAELQEVSKALQLFVEEWNQPKITESLKALELHAKEVGKAWGHSWLGYQSRVYYENLEPPPPGAHFSSEWGFKQLLSIPTTSGDWTEFQEGAIEAEIKRRAGNPDISDAEKLAADGRRLFEQRQDDIVSILQASKRSDNKFLENLIQEIE
ncbi:MAG TPA: hypothetical protein VHZ55_03110 [Bryobacteraceae bacterium]|nr:hypothetical protein [Bryobacteraceae bacterium]